MHHGDVQYWGRLGVGRIHGLFYVLEQRKDGALCMNKDDKKVCVVSVSLCSIWLPILSVSLLSRGCTTMCITEAFSTGRFRHVHEQGSLFTMSVSLSVSLNDNDRTPRGPV